MSKFDIIISVQHTGPTGAKVAGFFWTEPKELTFEQATSALNDVRIALGNGVFGERREPLMIHGRNNLPVIGSIHSKIHVTSTVVPRDVYLNSMLTVQLTEIEATDDKPW